MLLIIDNYDSFTYNLVQYFGELGITPKVIHNDTFLLEDIIALKPQAIVISPGPGTPKKAGISKGVIGAFSKLEIPILGVCLGMQAIVEEFGGIVSYAPYLMHGKTSEIKHNDKNIFKEIKNPFTVMRYHSLAAMPSSLPIELEISSITEDGVIMGINHKSLPIFGVQFHPESILTEYGHQILDNFLKIARLKKN